MPYIIKPTVITVGDTNERWILIIYILYEYLNNYYKKIKIFKKKKKKGN